MEIPPTLGCRVIMLLISTIPLKTFDVHGLSYNTRQSRKMTNMTFSFSRNRKVKDSRYSHTLFTA